jgi:hypothetical protein
MASLAGDGAASLTGIMHGHIANLAGGAREFRA